jgi:hypothetical protein
LLLALAGGTEENTLVTSCFSIKYIKIMVRAIDIQEKLLHLIGWEQNYDTSDLKISDALTVSESGLYFQQIHPLLTLQNMSCIAPDFKNMTFEEYNAEKPYSKGNVIKYGSLLYKALQNSTGKQPDIESEYWVETNPFSEWLESKTKASIQKSIARYCNEKIAQGTYKTLCENKTLFDGTGRLVDVVKNKKNLVGFEIVPIRAKGVTTKINKIGLQFTEPGEYTLYLMHSSMDAPVKIIKLNKIRKNSIEWFSLNDVYLPYQSEDNDAGGSWYLCYFQSELPEGSQAIRKDKDWSKEPCNSCSRREYLAWMAWSKYIEVHPFFVNEELINGMQDDFNDDFNNDFSKQPIHLWDVENNQYTYDNNYGLNLEITISCDITDFIIEQRMLFQDIIAKQVAVDMLREFAYNASVRTNRHSINASRLDILYEVDGDSSSMKKSGLSYQLDMAFKAIKLSTEGIDRVCLPCKNNGIKYRTV